MKRGLKTLIAGILLFLIGAVAVPIAVIVPLFSGRTAPSQFVVPGSVVVPIEKPGRYVLWNDFKTTYEGRLYNGPEDLPDGLRISVADSSGRELRFTSDSGTSVTMGGSSKRSVGHVEVEGPTTLSVTVEGETPPRVFSFGESVILKAIGKVVGGIALSLLFLAAGVGIGVWGVVKLADSGKKNGAVAPR